MHPVSRCWLFLQSSPLPRSQSWPPARCHVERVATSTTAALFAHGVGVDLLLFYLFPPFFPPLLGQCLSISTSPHISSFPHHRGCSGYHQISTKPFFRTQWAPLDNFGISFPGCGVSPIPPGDFSGWAGWDGGASTCGFAGLVAASASMPGAWAAARCKIHPGAFWGGFGAGGYFAFWPLLGKGLGKGVGVGVPSRAAVPLLCTNLCPSVAPGFISIARLMSVLR